MKHSPSEPALPSWNRWCAWSPALSCAPTTLCRVIRPAKLSLQVHTDNQFCIADIAVCSPFVNMRIGNEHVDAERWPKFSAYLERVLSRPAYKTAVAGLPDSL